MADLKNKQPARLTSQAPTLRCKHQQDIFVKCILHVCECTDDTNKGVCEKRIVELVMRTAS